MLLFMSGRDEFETGLIVAFRHYKKQTFILEIRVSQSEILGEGWLVKILWTGGRRERVNFATGDGGFYYGCRQSGLMIQTG